MASLFKKTGKSSIFPGPQTGKPLNAYQKRAIYDKNFSQIKDTLRKKNKAKAQAEAIVMEWYETLN